MEPGATQRHGLHSDYKQGDRVGPPTPEKRANVQEAAAKGLAAQRLPMSEAMTAEQHPSLTWVVGGGQGAAARVCNGCWGAVGGQGLLRVLAGGW